MKLMEALEYVRAYIDLGQGDENNGASSADKYAQTE